MMKLLLLVLFGAALVAAAFAAEEKEVVDNAVHPDAPSDGVQGYYGNSYYCCYKIKKELVSRIENFERGTATAFLEMNKSVKANLDRVIKMEKKLEDQEDFDFAELQAEVSAVATVVGEVEDEVKDLKGVEKKRHDHFLQEIKRLEAKIGGDEGEIDDEIKDVIDNLKNLTADQEATKAHLGEAESEIAALNNKTEHLDGRLQHIGDMTIQAFGQVDGEIANVSSAVAAAFAQGSNNAAAIAALSGRAGAVEAHIESIEKQDQATLGIVYNLSNDVAGMDEKFSGALQDQGKDLNSLKEAQDALKAAVSAVEAEAGSNSTMIHANAQAIAEVQQLVSDQGKKIDENAADVAALSGQMKQLVDSVEALRQNLMQHREDVVEQMKKLTEAIAN